jgi:hypothetical protein
VAPYRYVKRGFGRVPRPSWTMPDGGTLERLRHAVLQHEHLFRWSIAHRFKWKNATEFCRAAGLSPAQFGRVQRGESWITPTDVATLVRLLADDENLRVGLVSPAGLAGEMKRAEALVQEERQESEHQLLMRAGIGEGRQLDWLTGTLNIFEQLAIGEVEQAARANRERIVGLVREIATRPLRRSLLRLHKSWFPACKKEPEVDVRFDLADPGGDPVYAIPTEEAIFGEVQLGPEWVEGAKRSGLTEVDGHFIIGFRRFDDADRLVEVDALRLLPTAWSPSVPVPNDPEYASSPATIAWSEDGPHLRWLADDPLEASAAWLVRFSAVPESSTPSSAP